MGRRREGNYTLQKKIQWKIQWEKKEIDIQFLTPTKQ
jgi:hypothetical protein